MSRNKSVLIMAGGTGGHVFPGLAVASKLKEEGHNVSWLGTREKMEAKIVPEHGFEIDFIEISGVRKNGIKRLLLAPFKILKSIIQAMKIIKKRKVDLVVGMGGFVTGPGGIAAWLMGVPVIIHEQNAVAGLTNRILSHFSKYVLMGFPGAIKNKKAILVGNPVRQSFIDLPKKEISKNDVPLNLLIIGGSLGAKYINELIPKVAMDFNNSELNIIHQCGKGKFGSVNEAFSKTSLNVDLQEFIDDVAKVYDWADLIICRAGALTVSEVAVAGLPAIFIPLPYAVDDHQTKNAQTIVDHDGALLFAQNTLNIEKFSKKLKSLCKNRDELSRMSVNTNKTAIVDATLGVVSICNKFLK